MFCTCCKLSGCHLQQWGSQDNPTSRCVQHVFFCRKDLTNSMCLPGRVTDRSLWRVDGLFACRQLRLKGPEGGHYAMVPQVEHTVAWLLREHRRRS